jgi:integrase
MGIYKRSGSSNWWYRFQFKKKQIRGSTGTQKKADAEQVEAKRKRELWEQDRLGVKPSKLWEEAAAAYLSRVSEGRNKRQTAGMLQWLDQFLHGMALGAINQAMLTTLQEKKALAVAQRAEEAKAAGRNPRTERASPGTVNRVVGVVVAVLNYSVRAGWLDRAPKVAHLPDPAKRVRYITRDLAEALIRELPQHLSSMVVFSLETGLRKSNVRQLRWSEVDLERELVWVHPDEAKAGRGIAVPLTQRAVAVLEEQFGIHQEFVFTYRGRPVSETATRAWRKALARAGIANFRWHDLRHTWASWHRQSGTPQHVLKELGGWADDRMVGRYAHLGVDHLAEYVRRHENFSTETATGSGGRSVSS